MLIALLVKEQWQKAKAGGWGYAEIRWPLWCAYVQGGGKEAGKDKLRLLEEYDVLRYEHLEQRTESSRIKIWDINESKLDRVIAGGGRESDLKSLSIQEH